MPLDELNKRLLIALGVREEVVKIIIDYADDLRSEAGKLRTQNLLLEQDLKEAGMGRCTCSDCGKTVGNAWRDSNGHHCLTCLATEVSKLRSDLEIANQHVERLCHH